MATKRVYNPTDRPVVIDDEGHVLGGGEWGDIDTSTDLATSLLEHDLLLLPEDSKPTTAKTKE